MIPYPPRYLVLWVLITQVRANAGSFGRCRRLILKRVLPVARTSVCEGCFQHTPMQFLSRPRRESLLTGCADSTFAECASGTFPPGRLRLSTAATSLLVS